MFTRSSSHLTRVPAARLEPRAHHAGVHLAWVGVGTVVPGPHWHHHLLKHLADGAAEVDRPPAWSEDKRKLPTLCTVYLPSVLSVPVDFSS